MKEMSLGTILVNSKEADWSTPLLLACNKMFPRDEAQIIVIERLALK